MFEFLVYSFLVAGIICFIVDISINIKYAINKKKSNAFHAEKFIENIKHHIKNKGV
ncbi:hypothetical protein PCURB6_26870 [Paenibacillus curdlanolyticus]|nr:hypothetical protein PCURB6_26870 [Paenibacillus curdlanolyticus]